MTRLTRIESYPFDSKFDGYDDEAYPVYDRAVGAEFLRATYEQFFRDGVFGTPASALQIGKAATGLQVTVEPGTAILQGTIGGNLTDSPVTLLLDDDAPVGKVTYSVMLRSDTNDDMRSMYFNVEKSAASSAANPTEPATGLAGIREIRLGYVVVPSGATDLSEAEVVNEKGTAVCPWAAPFEEIDASAVIDDLKGQSAEAYAAFLGYIKENKAVLDAALGDSAAAEIMRQLSALRDEVEADVPDAEMSAYLDGGESTVEAGDFARAHHLKAYSAKVGELVEGPLEELEAEIEELRYRTLRLSDYTWAQLGEASAKAAAHPDWFAHLVGQKKAATVNGASVDMVLVGVAHDDLADGGGKAGFTFVADKLFATHRMNAGNVTSGGWAATEMRSWLAETIWPTLPADVAGVVKEVAKRYSATAISGTTAATDEAADRLWIPSASEVYGVGSYGNEGARYQFWAEGGAAVKYSGSSAHNWWLRSVYDGTYFRTVYTDGSVSYNGASYGHGVALGFCI